MSLNDERELEEHERFFSDDELEDLFYYMKHKMLLSEEESGVLERGAEVIKKSQKFLHDTLYGQMNQKWITYNQFITEVLMECKNAVKLEQQTTGIQFGCMFSEQQDTDVVGVKFSRMGLNNTIVVDSKFYYMKRNYVAVMYAIFFLNRIDGMMESLIAREVDRTTTHDTLPEFMRFRQSINISVLRVCHFVDKLRDRMSPTPYIHIVRHSDTDPSSIFNPKKPQAKEEEEEEEDSNEENKQWVNQFFDDDETSSSSKAEMPQPENSDDDSLLPLPPLQESSTDPSPRPLPPPPQKRRRQTVRLDLNLHPTAPNPFAVPMAAIGIRSLPSSAGDSPQHR